MNAFLERYPDLYDLLVSLAILAGSALAARLASFLLRRGLVRAARRTASGLDDRLIAALGRPVTYAVSLAGAYVALHRLPIQDRWTSRLDHALFALAVVLAALSLIRAYGLLLRWYTTEARGAGREQVAREFGPLLSKLGAVLVVVVATITLLEHFGVNVQSLVVSLGVGSLAVGLAAQDTLANMFAGFTLMLDRPFRIGDRIQLASGEIGDVITIGIRATRLKTTDESILVVPNAVLVKERLLNQTQPTPHMTTRVDVPVAYGSDLVAVKRILVEAALGSPRVDPDRPPVALVTRFAEYAVTCRLVFWVKEYADQGLATSDVLEDVYRRFAEAGIEIPLPTQRVLEGVGGGPGSVRG